MAILQYETITIEATFESAVIEPVRVWIKRPSGATDGPYTMTARGDDWEYEYLYGVTEAGTHHYRVQSSDPVSAGKSTFRVEEAVINPNL